MTLPFFSLAVLFALLPLAGGGQPADRSPADRSMPDYEVARDAVGRGEFLPLEEILAIVSRDHPGQIIEIELEFEDGVWEYEVELVTPDGRLIEIDLDAATGEILEYEEDDD
ncbi:PepSY domain-containing protein [Paracoccus sp. (in: a-proteobacteria)]|nr:PepSY domain-containing protein [Paracoccus sp. (in: a-proteobacteria)]